MAPRPQARMLVAGSAEVTLRLGDVLAGILGAGDVVGLTGDLGSGKTTLARGIIAGLGAEEPAVSPSFVLIREYRGRLPVYHMDLYRLERVRDLERIGVPDYLGGDGVSIVEWCERLGALTPGSRLVIDLTAGATAEERRLDFRPATDAWRTRLDELWPRLLAEAEGRS